MWGGNALTKKWGATANIGLKDGTGQGNTIAMFPTMVAGACAQFDLWRSSKNYRNKRLADAIRTWSGGNSVNAYVAFLTARVPGLTANTVINDDYLKSPKGVALMKAQAWHEAGKPYPMTDAEWSQAQAKVFGQPSAAKTAAVVVTTATAATAGAVQAGFSWTPIMVAVAFIAAVGAAVYFIRRANHTKDA
jgi:hypothetical protein